jgi:sugar/nucleoside kinase (ribokinase family)
MEAARVRDSGGVAVERPPTGPVVRQAPAQQAGAGDATLAVFVLTILGMKGKDVAMKHWQRLAAKRRVQRLERRTARND